MKAPTLIAPDWYLIIGAVILGFGALQVAAIWIAFPVLFVLEFMLLAGFRFPFLGP